MSTTVSLRGFVHLLREPDGFLALHLRHDRALWPQILTWFLPPMLVRPAAVFVRSAIIDAPDTATVLAAGSFALLVGAWLGVALVLPALGRQFQTPMLERDAMLVAGFASVPLWLAGALFVVPETSPIAFWWSRSVVFVLALYGIFIVHHAVGVLGGREDARWPLVVAISAAYAAIYFVLWFLVGVSSHAVLFILGARGASG